MKHSQEGCEQSMAAQGEVRPDTKQHRNDVPNDESSFLGKVGIGGATAAALAVGVSLESLIAGKDGKAEASVVPYRSNNRANDSLNYRRQQSIDQPIDHFLHHHPRIVYVQLERASHPLRIFHLDLSRSKE